MSQRTIKVVAKPSVLAATAIHDGSNSAGFPPKLEGFVVQALGDTHFGGPGITGSSDGFTVKNGDAVNILGFLSRGSPYAYDLTRLYYVGGPWKLVIEETV